jgi:hypothetical protein
MFLRKPFNLVSTNLKKLMLEKEAVPIYRNEKLTVPEEPMTPS